MRSAAVGRLAAAALLALGLTVASAAWACVPQPLLVVNPPASARVGDKLTVKGVNFRGPAEIRIDGIDGARLATASDDDFSVSLAVPRVRPGIHVLVAVTRGPGGELSGSASAPLEVVSSLPAAAGPRQPASGGGAGPGSMSSDPSLALLTAGGVGLLALGALLGLLLSRRRRPRAQLP